MTVTAPQPTAPPAAPWLDVEPDFDDAPPELALTDRAGADRHLVAIDRIEREFALEQAGALAEIERIRQWIAQRFEATTAEADWHRSILHRYHEAVLAVGGPKTIKLPHGELQARAQQPTWEIDGPTFLAWARENLPEAVRPPKPTEPTVDVAAAKRLLTIAQRVGDESLAVTNDGEVADGVCVQHRDPKFSAVIAAQDEPAATDGWHGFAYDGLDGEGVREADPGPPSADAEGPSIPAEEAADQANAMTDERDAYDRFEQ